MDEYDEFGVSDREIEEALNPGRKKHHLSKEQQIYGIWADNEPENTGKNRRKSQETFHGSKPAAKKSNNKKNHNNDIDEFGDWEKHTTGFGSKMLQKMGFKVGSGLGKDASGIRAPVEAVVRVGRAALGSNDFSLVNDAINEVIKPTSASGQSQSKTSNKVGSIDDKDSKNKDDTKYWRKSNKKNSFMKKTFDQLLSDFNKSHSESFNKLLSENEIAADSTKEREYEYTKVIDLTKSEPKISFGYENISVKDEKIKEKEAGEIHDQKDQDFLQSEGLENIWYFEYINKFKVPEISHNIELLIKMVEKSIVSQLKRSKIKEEVRNSFDEQKKNLLNVIDSVSSEYESLEILAGNIKNLKDAVNDESDPILKANIFIEGFEVIYSEPFSEFGIDGLLGHVFYPIIVEVLQNWDPFGDGNQVLEIFAKWRECVETISKNQQEYEGYLTLDRNNFYEKTFRDLWLPRFSEALISYDMSQFAILLANLSLWRQITSSHSWDMVRKVVLACIITQIDETKFSLSQHLDKWVLEYKDLIGDDMVHAYKAVMKWLMKNFSSFDPSDSRFIDMIKPWKKVFTKVQLDAFLMKSVITRIIEYLDANLHINPKNQVIDPLVNVLKWRGVVEDQILANIISRLFSRKWLNVLYQWLNSDPNYADVKKWYSGWKSLLNPFINYPSISGVFAQALQMIEQGLNKQTISTPKEFTFSLSESKPVQKTQPKIQMTFKEIVEASAIENHLIFTPTSRKRPDGKIIYQFSNSFIYVDRDVIFMENKDSKTQRWVPISLPNLLEISK